jgi:hypothetical protein
MSCAADVRPVVPGRVADGNFVSFAAAVRPVAADSAVAGRSVIAAALVSPAVAARVAAGRCVTIAADVSPADALSVAAAGLVTAAADVRPVDADSVAATFQTVRARPATATEVTIHALAGVDPATVTVWLSVPAVFDANSDPLLYAELVPVVCALLSVDHVPPGADKDVMVLCALVEHW